MFAPPSGKPIDPRRDITECKALLREADLRDARLHDARHTAATTLLLLGVPERAVMDVIGDSEVHSEVDFCVQRVELKFDTPKPQLGFHAICCPQVLL